MRRRQRKSFQRAAAIRTLLAPQLLRERDELRIVAHFVERIRSHLPLGRDERVQLVSGGDVFRARFKRGHFHCIDAHAQVEAVLGGRENVGDSHGDFLVLAGEDLLLMPERETQVGVIIVRAQLDEDVFADLVKVRECADDVGVRFSDLRRVERRARKTCVNADDLATQKVGGRPGGVRAGGGGQRNRDRTHEQCTRQQSLRKPSKKSLWLHAETSHRNPLIGRAGVDVEPLPDARPERPPPWPPE